MAVPVLNGKTQFLDASGVALALGTVSLYIPGTTTPKQTWQDQGKTVLNTTPTIDLDAGGYAMIYGSGAYRQIVKDALGNTIWDQVAWANDPDDTIATIEELYAASSGAGLIGSIQTGSGAVARTVQSKVSDIVSALDFGALADGAWDGSTASGTDNASAFTAALTACATLGRRLYVPAGVYYLAQGITLPAGVEMVGDGYVGLGTFVDNDTRTGTILLVNTASAGSSIKWTENSHGGALSSLSVFDVGGGSISAIINVTGVLHPHMENIEFSSLNHADGAGLLLDSSTTGDAFETLYGSFANCYCTQSATVANAGVAYGLKIIGRSTSPSKRANDNHFFGGDFAGYKRPLDISALVAGGGIIGCSFHGTTFEATWTLDGSSNPYMTVDYVSSGYQILGNSLTATAYSVRLVNLSDARQVSFHGCYFELGGNPGTYNDGTHGSLTLFPTIWLDNTNYVKATAFFGCSFNNAYIYDNAVFTTCDTTTDFHRYSGATGTGLTLESSATTSITGTYAKVPFSVVSGDSYLTWDEANNQAQIWSAGWYDITARLTLTGWTGASQSAVCQVVGGGHTKTGTYGPAAGQAVSTSINCKLYLFPGDTIYVQARQDSGSSQALTGDAKENVFEIVKVA